MNNVLSNIQSNLSIKLSTYYYNNFYQPRLLNIT